jgi:hypothetical protein
MQALECFRQPAFIPPDRDDDADERLLCVIIPNTPPPISSHLERMSNPRLRPFSAKHRQELRPQFGGGLNLRKLS